jgi:hypothetical protein
MKNQRLTILTILSLCLGFLIACSSSGGGSSDSDNMTVAEDNQTSADNTTTDMGGSGVPNDNTTSAGDNSSGGEGDSTPEPEVPDDRLWADVERIFVADDSIYAVSKNPWCQGAYVSKTAEADFNRDGKSDLLVLVNCAGGTVLQNVVREATQEPVLFWQEDSMVKILCGSDDGYMDCTQSLTGEHVFSASGSKFGFAPSLIIDDLNNDEVPDVIFGQHNDTSQAPDRTELSPTSIENLETFCRDTFGDAFVDQSIKPWGDFNDLACWYSSTSTVLLSTGGKLELNELPLPFPVFSYSSKLLKVDDVSWLSIVGMEGSFWIRFDDGVPTLVANLDEAPISALALDRAQLQADPEKIGNRVYHLGKNSIKSSEEHPECDLSSADFPNEDCVTDGVTLYTIEAGQLSHVANWDAQSEPAFTWHTFEMIEAESLEKVNYGGYCNYNAPCSAFRYSGRLLYGGEASPLLFGYPKFLSVDNASSSFELVLMAKTLGPWGDYVDDTVLQSEMLFSCETSSNPSCKGSPQELREKGVHLKLRFTPEENILTLESFLFENEFSFLATGVREHADYNDDGVQDAVFSEGGYGTNTLYVSQPSGRLALMKTADLLPKFNQSAVSAQDGFTDFNKDGLLDVERWAVYPPGNMADLPSGIYLELFRGLQNLGLKAEPYERNEWLDITNACIETGGRYCRY